MVLLTPYFAVAAEDPSKQADVTTQVSSLLKDNKLVFTVSNDLLGDPSSGDQKRLRIDYTIGDKARTRTFLENSDVSIIPTDGQKLVIKKAVYGVLESPADVTAKVAAAVKDNSLSLSVDNDTIGIDPANAMTKQLKVTYIVDGVSKTVTANEGDTLTIPKPDGGKALVIDEATYYAQPQ
jgi:hypothetical protein